MSLIRPGSCPPKDSVCHESVLALALPLKNRVTRLWWNRITRLNSSVLKLGALPPSAPAYRFKTPSRPPKAPAYNKNVCR